MKRGLMFGFVAAGLLLAAGISQAADYCVTLPDSLVFVGRGFAVPAKGTCKAWIGFTALGGQNSPSSGTGCTSSDGKHLNLMFTTGFAEDGAHFEEDQIVISLPAGTASDFFTEFLDAVADSGGPIAGTAAKCSKVAIPAVANPQASSQLRRSTH